MNSWQRLLETWQGLRAAPHNTDNASDTAQLYFRPTARSDWPLRALPGKRCFFLRHEKEKQR